MSVQTADVQADIQADINTRYFSNVRVYLRPSFRDCRYTNLLKLTPAVNIVKASYLDEQKA